MAKKLVQLRDMFDEYDFETLEKEDVTDVAGRAPLHTLNAYSSNYGFCVTQTDVVDYFEPSVLAELKENPKKHKSTTEKEHSAIVTREYFLEDSIKWLYNREQWAGLKSIGCIRKTIKPNNPGKPTTVETRYYISSLRDIDDFSRAVREHWGVENGLHWHLDFTFKDDKNTTMATNGAKGLQIFKKLAMAIIKMAQCLYPKRTSLKMIRYLLCMCFEDEIGKIFSMMNPDNLVIAK